jgi:mannose-6-phosphate isomerase-like protein (cupin superfamily)
MTTSYIRTGDCPRVKVPGNQGEVSEILNHELCGAKNVRAMLRWLGPGQQLDAQAREDTHQLVYLMEGEGVVTLNSKQYPVAKGAGFYLGPSESASIRQEGNVPLKLFHLMVPKLKKSYNTT